MYHEIGMTVAFELYRSRIMPFVLVRSRIYPTLPQKHYLIIGNLRTSQITYQGLNCTNCRWDEDDWLNYQLQQKVFHHNFIGKLFAGFLSQLSESLFQNDSTNQNCRIEMSAINAHIHHQFLTAVLFSCLTPVLNNSVFTLMVKTIIRLNTGILDK